MWRCLMRMFCCAISLSKMSLMVTFVKNKNKWYAGSLLFLCWMLGRRKLGGSERDCQGVCAAKATQFLR